LSYLKNILFSQGRHECLPFYLYLVCAGNDENQTTLANTGFPTLSTCTRKPEAAVPRMGGFTGVVPEFVCPPPPDSLTAFQIPGKWDAHL
jgi:hypothetical protein